MAALDDPQNECCSDGASADSQLQAVHCDQLTKDQVKAQPDQSVSSDTKEIASGGSEVFFVATEQAWQL